MGDLLITKVRHDQDYVIVTVVGEIDISTVSPMRECLFDLDQVSFIDSTGFDALAGTAKRAAACGGGLYAVCSRPKIRELFRLTGLACRIPLASTLAEALEAVAAARATS